MKMQLENAAKIIIEFRPKFRHQIVTLNPVPIIDPVFSPSHLQTRPKKMGNWVVFGTAETWGSVRHTTGTRSSVILMAPPGG